MTGLITEYLGSGLAAARPASPAVSAGSSGFYVATDTGVVSVWDGDSWATLGGGNKLTFSAFLSGRYFPPDTLYFQSGGTTTVASGELYLLPYSRRTIFNRMSVHFTAVGAGISEYKLGVYDSNPDTGLPRNILAESASTVAATTGLKHYDLGFDITPTAPLWLAFEQNANLTLVTGTAGFGREASVILGNTALDAAAPSVTGVSRTMAYGAFPADLTGLVAIRNFLAMITVTKV